MKKSKKTFKESLRGTTLTESCAEEKLSYTTITSELKNESPQMTAIKLPLNYRMLVLFDLLIHTSLCTAFHFCFHLKPRQSVA